MSWLDSYYTAGSGDPPGPPSQPPAPPPSWLANYYRQQAPADATAAPTGLRPDTPIPNNTIRPLTDPAELAALNNRPGETQQNLQTKALLSSLASSPLFMAMPGGEEEKAAAKVAEELPTLLGIPKPPLNATSTTPPLSLSDLAERLRAMNYLGFTSRPR